MVEGPLYTFTLTETLYLSSAVLNVDTIKGNSKGIQLWLKKGTVDHLVALIAKTSPYIKIDLKFDKDETIGFYIQGKGEVYMSGYSDDGQSNNGNPPNMMRDCSSGIKPQDASLLKVNSSDSNTMSFNNGDNADTAKSGDDVEVYYVCRLQPNDRVVMSQSDTPFKFTLGDGSVCKGMNAAIVGMKVGEKKKVDCLPDEAYGKSGIPCLIPPNATVSFEIELISSKSK